MSISDKELVVQHNRIVEARYKLSVGEQRLMKLLISMIEKDDEDFKVYPIEIKAFYELLGISDNDFYGKIKAISKKLLSNVLIFRDFDGRELQVCWLSSAEYIEKKGLVELEFSPKLKPFLLQLKNNITYYKLANIIYLKHTYSIRIYELLKQYSKIGRRKFEIQEFRKIIGIAEHEYQQFSDFRKRVLKVAQQEITEKTDISFTWEEEKKRQKCIAIEFFIQSKNPQPDNETTVELNELPVLPIPQSVITVHPLIDQLKNLGVSAKMAQSLVKNHAETAIQAAITYTQAQHAAGKVTNTAGFVVEAIKNGYTPPAEKAKPSRKKPEPPPKVDNLQYFADLRKRYADAPIPPEYEAALKARGLW